MKLKLKRVLLSTALTVGVVGFSPVFAAWEPTKPVEFIIPAGPGGGADQMARMIQGIITKNNLMKQSIIPVNKSAGAGAEGFLAMKEAKGDPKSPFFVIKADDKAVYRNLIDLIDEFNICNVGKYAVTDIMVSEVNLINQATKE